MNMSDTEKKILDRIKVLMKNHGITSYCIGVFDLYIGKIKVVPKGWKRLLVPIKGYYYDDFELEKIMHLNGELYFVVKKEYQTYNVPFKKEFFRFTWDEFVNENPCTAGLQRGGIHPQPAACAGFQRKSPCLSPR